MQKSIYFRMETKRFEDDLEQKIESLENETAQLQDKDQNVQDIVNCAAQNMRTSLVVIKAYSNLLMHYDGQEKEEALSHMRASALKIERIINRMIELTNAQKKDVLNSQKISFDELLEEVKIHLVDDIEVARPTFQQYFSVKSIYYNKFNIFSLLFCVLDNSLSYRKEEEPLNIQIRSYKEANYTVLEIVDNGKGFDLAKNTTALFKPFSKFAANQDGLGTGLYLVKTIIEKNGGYVEIDSTPNQGTVVKLFLKPTVALNSDEGEVD